MPDGKNWYDWSLYGGYVGDYGLDGYESVPEKQWEQGVFEIKCECGAHKVYGKEIPGWQHSNYCPLYMDDKNIK